VRSANHDRKQLSTESSRSARPRASAECFAPYLAAERAREQYVVDLFAVRCTDSAGWCLLQTVSVTTSRCHQKAKKQGTCIITNTWIRSLNNAPDTQRSCSDTNKFKDLKLINEDSHFFFFFDRAAINRALGVVVQVHACMQHSGKRSCLYVHC
jgi:hypothetical protein